MVRPVVFEVSGAALDALLAANALVSPASSLDEVDVLAEAVAAQVTAAHREFVAESGGSDASPLAPFQTVGFCNDDGAVALWVLLSDRFASTGVAQGPDGAPLDAEHAERAAACVAAALGVPGRILPPV